MDHFHDNDTQLFQIVAGQAMERGDFAGGIYDAVIRRNENRVQVKMSKEGNAWGCPMKITKGISLNAGSDELEIAYLVEGLPPASLFHFSVEFNFAGLPAQADGRYFYNDHQGSFGHLELNWIFMISAISTCSINGWASISDRHESSDQPLDLSDRIGESVGVRV